MKIKRWNKKIPIDQTKRVNFSCILIAPRRSGKTYFIQWLIEKGPLKNKYDLIMVFTTGAQVLTYEEFVDRKFVFGDISPEGIMTVINIVRKNNNSNEIPINTLVIFDDTCSRKEKYNRDIAKLYSNGRHSNISVIYSVQDGTLVDNIWKENSDYIFIFKCNGRRHQEYIVDNMIIGLLDKEFNSVSAEKKYYINMFKEITKTEFHMMVVDFIRMDIFWFMAGSI